MKSHFFRTRPDALAGADSWAERLRAAGLKATGPRLAILAFLEEDRTHASAQQIFAALRPRYPSLSLSTVYETLDAFLEAGICRAVAGEGALLRVDGTSFPHDHAVCRECGRIFDVEPSLWPHPDPPSTLPGSLAVTGMRVEYEVVCRECAEEGTWGAGVHQSLRRTPPRPEGEPNTSAPGQDGAATGSGGNRRSPRGEERRSPSDRRRGVERRRA